MYNTLQKIKFLCITSKYRRTYHISRKSSHKIHAAITHKSIEQSARDGHETRGQMQKKRINTDRSTLIIAQTLSGDNVEPSPPTARRPKAVKPQKIAVGHLLALLLKHALLG